MINVNIIISSSISFRVAYLLSFFLFGKFSTVKLNSNTTEKRKNQLNWTERKRTIIQFVFENYLICFLLQIVWAEIERGEWNIEDRRSTNWHMRMFQNYFRDRTVRQRWRGRWQATANRRAEYLVTGTWEYKIIQIEIET